MKIIIDCGHYYNTPGKRVPKALDPEECREWTLNQLVGRQLQSLLSTHSLPVIRADDTTGMKEVTLKQRVSLAAKDDIYISIHHNAGINLGYGGGIVVYRGTKYSNQIVEAASKELQSLVYDELILSTDLVGNRSNPKPVGNLYVLNNVPCTAILCELGFMDSKTDWPMYISQPDYPERAARGIYRGLMAFLKAHGLFKEEVKDLTDNIPSSWATVAVNWGIKYNLLTGDDTGNLKLHEPVTREQLMVILKKFSEEG